MATVTVTNRTIYKLGVPTPINRVLQPRQSVTLNNVSTDQLQRSSSISQLITQDLLFVTIEPDATISDELESVDALKTDTIDELTTDAGVTIEGVKHIDNTIQHLLVSDTFDATKRIHLSAQEISTGTLRQISMPDRDINLGYAHMLGVYSLTYDSFNDGTSEAVYLGSPLPTGAEILAAWIEVVTPFTGGTITTATVELGDLTAANRWQLATSVRAPTGRKRRPGAMDASASGSQFVATVTADALLNQLTAGAFRVYFLYSIVNYFN